MLFSEKLDIIRYVCKISIGVKFENLRFSNPSFVFIASAMNFATAKTQNIVKGGFIFPCRENEDCYDKSRKFFLGNKG